MPRRIEYNSGDAVGNKGCTFIKDLPSIRNNTCIEYDGGQHFFPVKKWGGVDYLKDVQERDTIKNNYAQQQGIKLIRISYKDMSKINANYIAHLLFKEGSVHG